MGFLQLSGLRTECLTGKTSKYSGITTDVVY